MYLNYKLDNATLDAWAKYIDDYLQPVTTTYKYKNVFLVQKTATRKNAFCNSTGFLIANKRNQNNPKACNYATTKITIQKTTQIQAKRKVRNC